MIELESADAIHNDPLGGGIAEYGRRLRLRLVTVQEVVAAYLERIKALDPKLKAFEHVATEQALSTAAALDKMLEAGLDLGPLMGVPIAVKDLIAVEGMPTTAGSTIDVSDIIGREGNFVSTLKRKGCVILGKTKTTEFGLGAFSTWLGTPWNPRDLNIHRTPGGSSSGSAVAVAAGLCGFAIGTDTGGSIRVPAAFCGVVGLKTTVGLWPTDGIFPLSRTFDTVGLLTKSTEDAAIAFAAIEGKPLPEPVDPHTLVLANPKRHFRENISPIVEACFDDAISLMQKAGVHVVEFDFPEATIAAQEFSIVGPIELLATLSRERFLKMRERMDPTVSARMEAALSVTAETFVQLMWLRNQLEISTRIRLSGVDAVLSPTALITPPEMKLSQESTFESDYHRKIGWNTRPASVLGTCAGSLPIHRNGESLPVGLQIICGGHCEVRALSILRTVESLVVSETDSANVV